MIDGLAASMLATGRESLASAQADKARQAAGRASSGDLEKVREKALEFEAMFLSQMFNHMFSGMKTDPLFGGGAGEETWKSLLVDEYAKATARAGGVGMADHVMQAMLQAQEVSR